jgi:hypothetical protein
MMNESIELYDALLSEVDDQKTRRVVVGVNWTLVESENGCGLAHTPQRDATGCQPIANAGKLTDTTLRATAALITSDNPMEAAIGMAGINAFYNTYNLVGSNSNGLDTFEKVVGPVTVVGRFPGLEKRIQNLHIIERAPREGEFGEEEADQLLPESAAVILTASTLVNGSAGRLLKLARGIPVALVGPSTPLAPPLYDLGVNILAGMVVDDVEGAAIATAQGGAVRALKQHGRFVTLEM